jgi:hypothetical protein
MGGRRVYLVRLEAVSPINLNLECPTRLSNLDLNKMTRIPVIQIATGKCQVINMMVILETDALVVQESS